MRSADVIPTRLTTTGGSIFVTDSTDGQNGTDLHDGLINQASEDSFQNSGDNCNNFDFGMLLAFVSGSTVGSSRCDYVRDDEG